jgi:hypothetical protein
MFRELEEAILSMERSKREVELRIKARAQSVIQREPAPAATTEVIIPDLLKVPRFRIQGRTMYTSGSRSWKK